MNNYSFTDNCILRLPLSIKQLNLSWEKVLEIFSKNENREALFIASPSLYERFLKWENNNSSFKESDLMKLKISLYKYASRLSNRSTPFGLFATVSFIKIESKTKLDIDSSIMSKSTRFDMFFLAKLNTYLLEKSFIKSNLKFFSNNSIYEVYDKYRYVEYYYKNKVRYHKVSEVDKNSHLALIIVNSLNGASINELAHSILDKGISIEEATSFINLLIENQFLISEFDFTLTGEDYFSSIINMLVEKKHFSLDIDKVLNFLLLMNNKLNTIELNSCNDYNVYEELYDLVSVYFPDTEKSKLIQVDGLRTFKDGSLSFKYLKQMRSSLIILNKLLSKPKNELLDEFKKKFHDKFGDSEQSLVHVLDTDVGIGYGNISNLKSSLVDDLSLTSSISDGRNIYIDTRKTYLLTKLTEALDQNKTQIELFQDDKEILKFKEDESLYSDTFSVFSNVFNENNTEKINLKFISGPSANVLIGRFIHLSKDINELCLNISNPLLTYSVRNVE